ncbi:MAG: aminotransferase class IV [Cephaloticoccus sp.]|nr:aminotransferase class IV [Cephaloticoccus sp.]MCF7761493.1 aminotransferase class IV [Cephaloticoccus sp.]
MRPDFIQANTNGRLHDAREPSLPPLNRGYLYGDAVYEVWRTYDGVLFAWVEHWQRLLQSAAALHMDLPWDAPMIWREIERTVAAFRVTSGYAGELYVRLQISRGAGAIGLDVGLADGPDFTLLVQANKDIPARQAQSGYMLSLESTLRRNPANTLNPAWKTGNYLNNILCLREAISRGADDVLMINLRGEITEAATSNIGFFRDRQLVTPPLSAGILGGVTRKLILREVAATAGLGVTERIIVPEEINSMEECFIMSTTRDIAPVGMIDQQPYRVGPETLTAQLKAAFSGYVRHYIAAHPELKLP